MNMRLIARLLLLIAALAYGAMPFTGMSAMAMPMPSALHSAIPATKAMEQGGTEHHGSPETGVRIRVDVSSNVDCPHAFSEAKRTDTGQGSMVGSHCSACLMLPVALAVADGGPPARAAEAVHLPHILLSRVTAPLTPPPRA